jgi:hypothetical protein
MTSYSITIPDNVNPGITAAVNAYNIAHAEVEGFVPFTNADYVTFVMTKAAESYCRQYNTGTLE